MCQTRWEEGSPSWTSAAIGFGFKGCTGKRVLLTNLGSYSSGMRLTVLMLPPRLLLNFLASFTRCFLDEDTRYSASHGSSEVSDF